MFRNAAVRKVKTRAAMVHLTAIVTFLLLISRVWMWWETQSDPQEGLFFVVFGIALFDVFPRFA